MNQEKWEQVKEIFHQVSDLSAEERGAFLDKACAGDSVIRERVDELLESYDSGFLEKPILHQVVEAIGGKRSFQAGQLIGRYKLKETLGIGGMGEVFLAEDLELKRLVAIKILHTEVAEDQERIRRFIQEARAASALNHPNILTIYEIGTFEDSRFIVSEYVKGNTLRERLRQKNLTLAESLEIASQIAAALETAHEAGIVHRDIKPENIMLRQDGLVKVLDFGLAKLIERKSDKETARQRENESTLRLSPHLPVSPSLPLTSPGLVMGTVAYMSPEQARGKEVDRRTDIWSLGVVLYEMLSGKMPFAGETTSDIIAAILKTEAEPLENLNKEIPREMEAICFKALAKKVNERYQTAQEFLEDLKGEKKRMESIMEQTAIKPFNLISEQETRPIRVPPTLSAEYLITSVKRHKLATFSSLILIVFLGVAVTVYQFNGAPQNKLNGLTMPLVIDADTTEKDLKFLRLVTVGKISSTAISPDGKYAAYVTKDENKSSLRLRQLGTTSDVELIPPTEKAWLRDLSFTPDGNYIYFSQSDMLFKIPTLGGSPTKIVGILDKYTYVSDEAAISPDGKRIAFTREDEEAGTSFLQIANADGSDERTIIKHSEPSRISAGNESWSPDGKSIAYGMGTREKDGQHLKLFSINVSDGSRSQLSESDWLDIRSIRWLSNGNLIICGKLRPTDEYTQSQVWLIAPNAPPHALTSDLNGYQTASVTANGDTLLAMQIKTSRNLWLVPNNDASLAKQITTSGEIRRFSWMPDGKIAFGSYETGNLDIWTMNADGTNRKQLTANQGLNLLSSATPDGRYLLFTRTNIFGNPGMINGVFDKAHIWRMDADGSNQKQLTNGNDLNPQSSPDGKWIYYTERIEGGRNICKISIDGGEPIKLATTPGQFPVIAVSPRTGMIAYVGIEGTTPTPKLIILSPVDNKPIKSLPIPPNPTSGPIKWLPDESAIAYIGSPNNSANIWVLPVDGKSEAKPLTNFTTEQIGMFDWSPETKQLMTLRGTQTSEAVLITRAK